MDFTLPVNFPDDLAEQILLRLPVRSLLRFKCVCKSFLALISHSRFAKSLYDLTEPTYRLFVKPNPAYLPVSIDLEASLHDDSAIACLTAPYPSSPSLNPLFFQIYGSCRGFILQRYSGDDNLILWNPSTGARKLIGYPDHVRNNEFIFGFGYDRSKNDYLIVIWQWRNPSSWGTDIHLFSFKTNSWTKTEGMDFPTGKEFDSVFRAGLFFNGALHWLACSDVHNRSSVIVSFDMMGRSLSEIPLPHDLTSLMMMNHLYNLVVIGGCLSVCKVKRMDMTSAKVEIWTMKEYKVQTSWTTSWTTISAQYTCGINFSPVWFTKGGDIVVGSHESGALMKLDDKGKLLEHRRCSKKLVEYMFLRKPQSAIYRESLLSLP